MPKFAFTDNKTIRIPKKYKKRYVTCALNLGMGFEVWTQVNRLNWLANIYLNP